MARILVVDDEAALRHSLATFLRAGGHEVREATSGAEAMSAFDDTPFDIVITDINMPDMDGIEIVTALRERSLDVAVIAMSGGGLLEKELLLDSAAALGADLTFEKPFEPGELQAAIERLMARRARGGRPS